MFLAKISKGRTIREFVVGVMIVPTVVSLLWFCIFGGSAIREFTDGKLAFDPATSASEDTLFDVLANMPWTAIASALVMILVAIFFVSGADSASLVMGTLSQRGTPEPSRWITIFWGVSTGAVAAVLLAVSGDDGLTGIKQMAIIAALPFVLVMVGMCVSLYMDLRRDPLIVARGLLSDRVDEHIREEAVKIETSEFAVLDPETGDPIAPFVNDTVETIPPATEDKKTTEGKRTE